jgi:hypothetical protein
MNKYLEDKRDTLSDTGEFSIGFAHYYKVPR